MRHDLSNALRLLRRTPALSIAAVLSLGLGLGVTTSLYAVARSVLFKPLPYDQPDRLVVLSVRYRSEPSTAAAGHVLSGGEVAALATVDSVFDSTATIELWTTNKEARLILSQPTDVERLRASLVSENFFEVLGIDAAMGRVFRPGDSVDGVVISDGLWRRRFGGAGDVIGERISLSDGPRVIVAVLPPLVQFTYPQETDLWAVRVDRLGASTLDSHVIGRLRPGVSFAQADAALLKWSDSARGPGRSRDRVFSVESLREWAFGRVGPMFWLLASIAALLLLAACSNAALLLVARSARYVRESAVRAALGASRRHLLRQNVVETAAIVGSGLALAMLFSIAVRPLIGHFLPPTTPRLKDVNIDAAIAVFLLGLGVVVMVVTSIAAGRTHAVSGSLSLQNLSATSTPPPHRALRRRALLIGQTALTAVLLTGAGLLLKSFWQLASVDVGFQSTHLAAFDASLFEVFERNRSRERIIEQEANLRERLSVEMQALPGVSEFAVASSFPFSGVDVGTWVPQPPIPIASTSRINANVRYVGPNFFSVLGIRVIQGRALTAQDVRGAPRVAVVSLGLSRALFGHQMPIGQTLQWGDAYEVVGVVNDVRWSRPQDEPTPAFYLALAQRPQMGLSVIARTSLPTAEFSQSVRSVAHRIDPDQPLDRVVTLDDVIRDATADQRFYAAVSLTFAALALALAGIGIFAAVETAVTERIREIGVRVALGATPTRIWILAVRLGTNPVLVGLLIGTFVSLAAARTLRRFLFALSPIDPIVFASTQVALLLVALVACARPALRALRVDPLTVLKLD